MLKIRKSKIKFLGIITCVVSLGAGYLGLTFYSIPEKASAVETIEETRTLSDITYMQEMTKTICANSERFESKALIDNRGGGFTNTLEDSTSVTNSYTVTKLDDGNCWMTQNLKLDISKEGILTPENSDVHSSWPTAEDVKTLTGKGWTRNNSKPVFNLGGNGIQATWGDSYDASFGNYYNFCAATAGGCSNLRHEEGEIVEVSICPKGFKLPTQAQYRMLISKYDGMRMSLQDAPSNFVLAGYLTRNNENKVHLGYAGIDGGYDAAQGNYWSSTIAIGLVPVYYLTVYRSDYGSPAVGGGDGGGILDVYGYGFSVRCMAQGADREEDSGIAVLINPYLTIEATTSMKETMGAENILHGHISATVASNGEYKVMLNTNQPNLRDENSPTFAGIPASSEVKANSNAWGIQNEDGTTYTAVTNTPKVFYSSDYFDENLKSTTHTFTVGVSVSPSIPAGKYSTGVMATAVNN